MPAAWRTPNREDRGAYTSVAQAEDGIADLTAHGKVVENGDLSNIHDEDSADKIRDSSDEPEYDDSVPTPEDLATLPRVSDKVPFSAFLVAIIELCERFAYYGLTGPFQNYMANSYNDPNGLPGAIGLKQSGATALSNFFQFWCYVTPIFGAIIADQYLGKYATIKYFSLVYMAGITILFLTSLPISIENGAAFPGLLAAMIIIGLGTGGIKSNVSPLIAEQVRTTKPFIKTLSSGKRVIVDPDVTVQRVYMIFYMSINIGSISAIATTTLELRVGFWSAYLLPLIMFCVGFLVLVWGKDRYVIRPPQGGVIGNCFKALWIASRNGFDLDAAKPSFQPIGRRKYKITWNDEFITELQTALQACKIFLFFPLYWLTYSQMLNNFISQAGQMQLHSLPNDILPNIDPLTLLILIPLLDRLIYPFLRTRLHLALKPTTRIALGFAFAALAMLYAAGLQFAIYASPPCYSRPGNCDAAKLTTSQNINAGDKFAPNEIHIAYQTPSYILIALSEVLASITGLEVAYAKAPQGMKSFIMSLFLLTSAVGSALGMLIAPLARDPWMGWVYVGLGALAAGGGGWFWWCFHGGVDAGVEEVEMRVRKGEESDGESEGREV